MVDDTPREPMQHRLLFYISSLASPERGSLRSSVGALNFPSLRVSGWAGYRWRQARRFCSSCSGSPFSSTRGCRGSKGRIGWPVSSIPPARWPRRCCSSCRSLRYIRRSNISVSRPPERWAERRSATCHRWRRSASSSPAFPSSHCLQWPRNGRGEPRRRCISHRCWLPYPLCSSWRISSGPHSFPREPSSRLRSTPALPSCLLGITLLGFALSHTRILRREEDGHAYRISSPPRLSPPCGGHRHCRATSTN